MRSYAKPAVETVKVKMLVSRVVNSVPVEAGDELVVQQPLAGMLLKQELAKEVKAAAKKKAD